VVAGAAVFVVIDAFTFIVSKVVMILLLLLSSICITYVDVVAFVVTVIAVV
jgi:hypothetical protein